MMINIGWAAGSLVQAGPDNRTNRSHIFRLNQGKPELEKNGAFQPEPPGKFPVEPEKPAQIFRISASTGAHP